MIEISKRIHVVGSGPRTGTTLMAELIAACFDVDGHAPHEMSVFLKPAQDFHVFCSKHPHEVLSVRAILPLDRDLWVICMIRDPRDMIVSRHRQNPNVYWANLRQWKQYSKSIRKLAAQPRFLTVRYEDLVRDPATVQERLMAEMPFLRWRTSFAQFHEIARPSEESIDALRGVRPIDSAPIGRWRQHKPRVAAQLQVHGSIVTDLIHFGYENDDSWLHELEGIEPNHYESHHPDHLLLKSRLDDVWLRWKRIVRYALGASPEVAVHDQQ